MHRQRMSLWTTKTSRGGGKWDCHFFCWGLTATKIITSQWLQCLPTSLPPFVSFVFCHFSGCIGCVTRRPVSLLCFGCSGVFFGLPWSWLWPGCLPLWFSNFFLKFSKPVWVLVAILPWHFDLQKNLARLVPLLLIACCGPVKRGVFLLAGSVKPAVWLGVYGVILVNIFSPQWSFSPQGMWCIPRKKSIK